MFFSNSFLKKCESLWRKGYVPERTSSSFVGRGFADLGSEPFCLLPSGKMVSLLSGHVSDAPTKDDGHFFSLPFAGDLVSELQVRGVIFEQIEFVDQREWKFNLRKDDKSFSVTSAKLEDALLEALDRVIEAG